jgi:hypothetical protein
MAEDKDLSIIERFREGHHAIARMFAVGMTPAMIRRNTGISMRRLSMLQGDVAFNELIAYYAKRIHMQWDFEDDVYSSMSRANMLQAEFTIQEHMERAADIGELIPIAIADRISQGRADRLGYSKHSIVTHNHDFASALDRAIERSGKAEEIKQIEGEVMSPPHSVPLADDGAGGNPSPPPPAPPSFAHVLRRRRIA